jgi:hypothetical protein
MVGLVWRDCPTKEVSVVVVVGFIGDLSGA